MAKDNAVRSGRTRLASAAVASVAAGCVIARSAGEMAGLFLTIAVFAFCAFLDEAIHPALDDEDDAA